MTVDEQAAYKAKIEEEINRIEQLVAGLKQENKPVTLDSSIGRLSRMDAINNKGITANTLRQSQLKLQRLENVYSRYGTEMFGKCLKCKKEIPTERLMLVPDALVCVACASG